MIFTCWFKKYLLLSYHVILLFDISISGRNTARGFNPVSLRCIVYFTLLFYLFLLLFFMYRINGVKAERLPNLRWHIGLVQWDGSLNQIFKYNQVHYNTHTGDVSDTHLLTIFFICSTDVLCIWAPEVAWGQTACAISWGYHPIACVYTVILLTNSWTQ